VAAVGVVHGAVERRGRVATGKLGTRLLRDTGFARCVAACFLLLLWMDGCLRRASAVSASFIGGAGKASSPVTGGAVVATAGATSAGDSRP